MGQASIPILNRVGYSMFWNSVWDDIHLFNKHFTEDILIRDFIKFIFNEKISTKPLFLTNLFFQNSTESIQFLKSFNLDMILDININSLSNYLFKINRMPNYTFKIHIWRFQTWLIIFYKFYTPSSNKTKIFLKQKKGANYLYCNRYFYISFLKNNFYLNSNLNARRTYF